MRKGYWIALGIILVSSVVYLSVFKALHLREKISTSVLDLVPAEQRDPQLELARTLAQSDQKQVLLIALQSADAKEPLSPGQRSAFIDSLRASGCFTSVFDLTADDYIKAAAATFFNERGALLLPAYIEGKHNDFTAAHTQGDAADFSPWLAQTIVADLDTFLDSPEAMAYQQLIPQDPLVLVLRTFEQWRKHNSQIARKPPPSLLTVWAQLKHSPFSPEGQQPVFDALEAARLAAGAAGVAAPLQLQSAGISRFAQANERGIRQEVAVFNIASVSLVLLVCALLLRSPSVLFHIVALLAVSLPLAWLATLLVFASVPIIALVVGSVLVGVTIDYCLHVFLSGKDTHEGSILRPLLLSCGTTTAAFLALLFSPLPLLKQTGVFVAVGLVVTCALALLYKRLLGTHIIARQRKDIAIRVALPWKLPAIAILLALLPGIAHINWNDNVDNLQYPLPHLRAEDAAVRALLGADSQTAYLSTGADYAQARTALEAFRLKTQQAAPEAQLTDLSAWTPTPQQYLGLGEFFRTAPDFSQQLHEALEAGGYAAESFAPFFTELAQWQAKNYDTEAYNALMAELSAQLSGPISNMMGGAEGMKFFLSIGSGTATDGTDATDTGTANSTASAAGNTASTTEDAAAQTTGTFKADSLYSLSSLFAHYRENALALSGYGLLAVILGSVAVYGLRRGAQVLLVPLVAVLATLGTLGYLHASLNLFHVIGLFLGVCLALDYGAFALRNHGRASVPYSVCVAAATTITSFLLLTFSRIPAVVALGSTVALCIAYGFATVVLLTIPPRKRNARRP